MFEQQRLDYKYQSYSNNRRQYMAKIIVLLVCLIVVAMGQTASFQVDGSRAVLMGDWVQKTQQLEQYVPQFQSVLVNKEIKSLTLSFAYCVDPQFIIDNFFSQPISVEILYINLDSCKLTIQQLTHLFQHINAQSVRHLHLNLNSATTSESAGKLLGQQIAHYDLRSLKLGLMMLKMGDEGVNQLFMHPLSEELQELSIDFTANKLGPDAFQNFSIFTSKLKPQRLRSVQLFVRSNRIEQNGTLFIAKALKNFNQLTVFKFDAYFNNLKKNAVKPINLLVKRMAGLKILTLNFDFNYIENEGGQLLGKAITSLGQLDYLEIGVGTKNFGYNGYFHIVDGISALRKLRSLTFRCGVNRIGSKAALKLRSIFKANPSLQYVELHLIENVMTDQGLELVAQSLTQLQHLKTFKLNFGYNEVRGKGVAELFKIVQQKQIKNIWIGLSNNAIDDSTITQLIPSIQRIFQFANSFELELLYTHMGIKTSNKLRQLFKACGGCRCQLYVNSREENEQIQRQIDARDEL